MEVVQTGEMSVDDVKADFMNSWDQEESDPVTYREFLEYYKDVSSAIEDDEYFEMLMRSTWHIVNELNLTNNGLASTKVLCTHADGRQTEEYVANDLGISRFDERQLKGALRRQGINAVRVSPCN